MKKKWKKGQNKFSKKRAKQRFYRKKGAFENKN